MFRNYYIPLNLIKKKKNCSCKNIKLRIYCGKNFQHNTINVVSEKLIDHQICTGCEYAYFYVVQTKNNKNYLMGRNMLMFFIFIVAILKFCDIRREVLYNIVRLRIATKRVNYLHARYMSCTKNKLYTGRGN